MSRLLAEESVSEQVVELLSKFIDDNVPEIREVYDEFPDPNDRIVTPSASLLTLTPKFFHETPRQVELPDLNGGSEYDIVWIMGRYEIPLQLDIWTSNKKERNNIFEATFHALNKRVNPAGLDIQLPKYFEQWAHYHIENYAFDDSEGGAQRKERRARVDIMADVNSCVKREEFAMKTISINETSVDEVDITKEDLSQE